MLDAWLEGDLDRCLQWVDDHLGEEDRQKWLALMLSDALWRQRPSLFPRLGECLFAMRQRLAVLLEHLQRYPNAISDILERDGSLLERDEDHKRHPSITCLWGMEKYHTDRVQDSVPPFIESAESGHPHAQWYLGVIYNKRYEQDARRMFSMSAAQGHASSMWYLSWYETSDEEALNTLERAASEGDALATRDFALLLANGPRQDVRRAVEIWKTCPVLFSVSVKTMQASSS